MACGRFPNNIVQSLLAASQTSSALSPKVRHLLCEVGLQDFSSNGYNFANLNNRNDATLREDEDSQATFMKITINPGYDDVACSQGFIQFNQCADMLPNSTELSMEEYYIRSVAAIAGTFRQAQCLLDNLSCEEFWKTYRDYFVWTKNPELFQECFQLLTNKNGADDQLSLLLLCSGLERALGNLYLLRGQQCPRMFKDLLSTQELGDILGYDAIKVLQLVIGPPMSMNIRNVSWHGFLSENELPRRYIFFLLLVTASLGKWLEKQGINSVDISFRDYFPLTRVTDMDCRLELRELSGSDITSLELFISKSWLISNGNINIFKSAVAHYQHHKFGSCVVLLLPLLEHALRKMFVVVNNCPDRLVTAEATRLYTTFEEILDVSLPDGMENKLVQLLGEPCMDLLHDLLIYPSGTRVRDKLGHGEADYKSVPEFLPRLLLILFTFLAGKVDDSQQIPVKEILCNLDNYSSVFHPVMLLHKQILHLCTQAADLQVGLETTPDLDAWSSVDGYDMFLLNNKIYDGIQEILVHVLEITVSCRHGISCVTELEQIKQRLSVPFGCIYQDVRSLLPDKIRTLYRWQTDSDAVSAKNLSTDNVSMTGLGSVNPKVGEREIVGILSRIITETETTLTQTRSALQHRQGQLASKQLRSRQRENLKKLLVFLPCASLLANYIAVLSTWQLCHLDDYRCLENGSFKAIQRFLKGTLQTCEHLRTFTSEECNKWSHAGEVLLNELKSAVKFLQLNIFTIKT